MTELYLRLDMAKKIGLSHLIIDNDLKVFVDMITNNYGLKYLKKISIKLTYSSYIWARLF